MNYWQYDIEIAPELSDVLVAYLSEGEFDTFEEMETGLRAYLPAREEDAKVRAEILLNDLKEQFDFSWTATFHPSQNWNEIWESNFQPVIVNDFCAVRADFHAPIPGVRYEMVINPKMAFGTGHHETTWQCMAAMEKLDLQGKILLDFGCGTGILAILAAMLGASNIEAVDIESESYENTLENSRINHVAAQISARCGILSDVQGDSFDGIFANINRHIILPSLPRLSEICKPGGWLMVSGILFSDESVVDEAATAVGFRKTSQTRKGDWLCILYEKK